MDGLQSLLSRRAAGDEVTIVVKRQNQNGTYEEKSLQVTLGKKTESVKQQQENQQSNSQQQQQQQDSNSQYNNQYNNSDDFWSFFN